MVAGLSCCVFPQSWGFSPKNTPSSKKWLVAGSVAYSDLYITDFCVCRTLVRKVVMYRRKIAKAREVVCPLITG